MIWRTAGVAVGTALLVGVAGAAVAAESGSGAVDVEVDITENDEPGVLALTVESASATLVENGSTDLVRQFTAELPTVTVTDTRSPEEIPEGAYWYVVGSASAFTGDDGQDPLPAESLGWAPQLIDGGESGNVAEGDDVAPELDGGPGLVGQELLAMAFDSSEIRDEQSWTATADLTMRVGADVAPGSYSSTITLSLFE
ncbi:MAG: hypothetical protein ACTMIY_10910 [Microbacterium gubbeenense]